MYCFSSSSIRWKLLDRPGLVFSSGISAIIVSEEVDSRWERWYRVDEWWRRSAGLRLCLPCKCSYFNGDALLLLLEAYPQ